MLAFYFSRETYFAQTIFFGCINVDLGMTFEIKVKPGLLLRILCNFRDNGWFYFRPRQTKAAFLFLADSLLIFQAHVTS